MLGHAPFVVGLLLIVVPWALVELRAWNVEVRRWQESDHPMTSSG